jgi:hypothetical protein
VDARIKSAQDNLGGDMTVDDPLLLQEKFPRTALRIAGEGVERSEAGEGSGATMSGKDRLSIH